MEAAQILKSLRDIEASARVTAQFVAGEIPTVDVSVWTLEGSSLLRCIHRRSTPGEREPVVMPRSAVGKLPRRGLRRPVTDAIPGSTHPDAHEVWDLPLALGPYEVGLLRLERTAPMRWSEDNARQLGQLARLCAESIYASTKESQVANALARRTKSAADCLAARDNALEVLADAILIVDGKGRIVDANTGAELTFGHTPESITGRDLQFLCPGLDVPRALSPTGLVDLGAVTCRTARQHTLVCRGLSLPLHEAAREKGPARRVVVLQARPTPDAHDHYMLKHRWDGAVEWWRRRLASGSAPPLSAVGVVDVDRRPDGTAGDAMIDHISRALSAQLRPAEAYRPHSRDSFLVLVHAGTPVELEERFAAIQTAASRHEADGVIPPTEGSCTVGFHRVVEPADIETAVSLCQVAVDAGKRLLARSVVNAEDQGLDLFL